MRSGLSRLGLGFDGRLVGGRLTSGRFVSGCSRSGLGREGRLVGGFWKIGRSYPGLGRTRSGISESGLGLIGLRESGRSVSGLGLIGLRESGRSDPGLGTKGLLPSMPGLKRSGRKLGFLTSGLTSGRLGILGVLDSGARGIRRPGSRSIEGLGGDGRLTLGLKGRGLPCGLMFGFPLGFTPFQILSRSRLFGGIIGFLCPLILCVSFRTTLGETIPLGVMNLGGRTRFIRRWSIGRGAGKIELMSAVIQYGAG